MLYTIIKLLYNISIYDKQLESEFDILIKHSRNNDF